MGSFLDKDVELHGAWNQGPLQLGPDTEADEGGERAVLHGGHKLDVSHELVTGISERIHTHQILVNHVQFLDIFALISLLH